jgi:hypothetical protein
LVLVVELVHGGLTEAVGDGGAVIDRVVGIPVFKDAVGAGGEDAAAGAVVFVGVPGVVAVFPAGEAPLGVVRVLEGEAGGVVYAA